jgi:hypothetical protein
MGPSSDKANSIALSRVVKLCELTNDFMNGEARPVTYLVIISTSDIRGTPLKAKACSTLRNAVL